MKIRIQSFYRLDWLALPLIFWVGSFEAIFAQSSTQDLASVAQALKLIRETAADVCYTIEQRGNKSEVTINGDAEAKLNGLLSKVADLGIKGATNVQREAHEGVVQEQLATAIKNSTDCRKSVFDSLVGKLLPSGQSGENAQDAPGKNAAAGKSINLASVNTTITKFVGPSFKLGTTFSSGNVVGKKIHLNDNIQAGDYTKFEYTLNSNGNIHVGAYVDYRNYLVRLSLSNDEIGDVNVRAVAQFYRSLARDWGGPEPSIIETDKRSVCKDTEYWQDEFDESNVPTCIILREADAVHVLKEIRYTYTLVKAGHNRCVLRRAYDTVNEQARTHFSYDCAGKNGLVLDDHYEVINITAVPPGSPS